MSRRRKDRKTKEETEKKYPRKCPECGENIVTGNGETYCDSCGLVITEDIIDLGPEWRAYDEEQNSKRARTGPPMTYRIYDEGLSLLHSFSTRTNVGAKSTNEISLTFALSEIDRMASALRLPKNIREDASLLYRKAMGEKILKGRSIEAITSAIIYIICRQYGVPRTLEEIEKVSWVKEEKISGAKKSLLRKLGLKIPPAIPCHFVPRFCFLLGLNKITESKALEITGKIKLNNGQSPTGIAAAAIYIAAILNDQHRRQEEIANIARVTAGTIRNRYKEISEQLRINIAETEN
jgi:transcription initiation factor TFIIB